MASTLVVTETSLPETQTLKFISRGKVRDLYEITDPSASGDQPDSYLLFIATDRISAYDVVLKNGVLGKGALLTRISAFWFSRLRDVLPNHVVASSLSEMPEGIKEQLGAVWEEHGLEGRTLLVRKAKVVKLEAIVRGYLTGSAWSEYKKTKTVHGIPLREGYIESDKLDPPLFTPSTKADQGEHDENISPDRAKEIIGAELYNLIAHTALSLFSSASAYAHTRGLILADTKFEFGLLPLSSLSLSSTQSPSKTPTISVNSEPHALILIDEALTPDSSRYWSQPAYAPGRQQASFDKQFLRDWMVGAGFRKGLEGGPDGKEGEGWVMTEEVVEGTRERYEDVVRMLMG